MAGQQAAPAYRIYHGDTIQATIWSNVAAVVDGFFRVVYDDGTTDTLRIDRVTTTSARAAFLARAAHVAKHDGYVTEGVLFADSPQRGQTYAIAYVSQGEGPGDVRMALCKGYVYAFTPLAVGQQVEPGPAGGPGAITRTFKAALTPLGTGSAMAVVPTGALWRWIAGIATYTATATAGTRSPTVRFRDGSANVIFTSHVTNPTANQTDRIEFAPNIATFLSIALGTNTGTEHPAPDRPLPAGYDVLLIDGAAIDVADSYQFDGVVEEWVMPN